MTWGQYFFPAGAVVGAVVFVGSVAYFIRNPTDNHGVAYGIPMISFVAAGAVMSISQLDRAYVAQEQQAEAARKVASEFAERVQRLAVELYEEYLKANPSDLIAYVKDRTPPAHFLEAARRQLQ